jgi:predicted DsbA family dithiol-disulfide isomerase
MGIRSVPTFIIDGRYAVQGAQPPEAFAQALLQARGEVPSGQAPDDAACGPDGCRV